MVRIKLNSFFILFLFASFYSGYIDQSITIFLSVLLHEIGHAIVAKALGIRVEEIELFPFGGIAKMEDISKYGGFIEAYIAIAGPMVSGLIALTFTVFAGDSEFFIKIAQYNFILMSFNIMPALPMDGGRILRNILLHYVSYKQATRIMVLSGRISAIALVLYNIYIIKEGINSIAYVITAVFIYLGCQKELKYSSYYYLLHKNNFKKNPKGRRKLRRRIIHVHNDTLIRHAANQFSPGSVCVVLVQDEEGSIIRNLSEADIMDAFLKYGYDGRISQIKKLPMG